ncbi:glutamate carboxypeptidase [Deinococcus metalli]|uniref:Carboxypeptidase n=1 Tax=Deinococcus metalli TaxID=1141878 RepID=A0A7W8KDK4_9DEIO|nr:glutamate carboxypeptidase [Deinococcus metalli]GHF39969.1 carboxypeptidase [Deinococcus metalli]
MSAQPDLTAMLADLHTLVGIESPSSDPVAVSRVMDVVEGWARDLGATTRALPGGTRSLQFGLDASGAERPLLILMHADTVWPTGTLERMPWRHDGDRLYGPGTYDMKGGIVGTVHALRALHGEWPRGGIHVLLSPDEEIGSVTSRPHIEAAAQGARAALVVEPPVADSHALKTGRKGTGGYWLTLHGIASHAGNRPADGASAITAAAEAVLAIHALARPEVGTTISAGVIHGGSAMNVIPETCTVEFDVRVSTLDEAQRVDDAVRAWAPTDTRVRTTLTGGLNRPPFEQGEATLALYARARDLARDLGFTLEHESVGGGSDGNFTAPITPTLDGLGAPGDGAHAAHEHIRLDRWPDHVRLLTRLLRTL